MRFQVVVVGHNCEEYAAECIESILSQKIPRGSEMNVWVLDDASTDGTAKILRDYDVKWWSLSTNRGAAYTRFQVLAYSGFRSDDVVVLVDLDDYLVHDRVLERVHREYVSGADVTYGSYEFIEGGSWIQEPYPDGCDYYRHPWRCAPLRTFRYGLFEVDPKRFIYKGEWIRKCTDVALMLPILSKAEKPAHIPDVLYRYRHNHPRVTRLVVSMDYKRAVEAYLRANGSSDNDLQPSREAA